MQFWRALHMGVLTGLPTPPCWTMGGPATSGELSPVVLGSPPPFPMHPYSSTTGGPATSGGLYPINLGMNLTPPPLPPTHPCS